MGIPIPNEQKEEIIRLHKLGLRKFQIVAKTSISWTTVHKYVSDYDAAQDHVKPVMRAARFVNVSNRNSGIPSYLV